MEGFALGACCSAQSASHPENIDWTRNGECIERDCAKAVAKRRGLGGIGGRCHGWHGSVEHLSSQKSKAGPSTSWAVCCRRPCPAPLPREGRGAPSSLSTW